MTHPMMIPTRYFWLSLLTLSPSIHAQTTNINTYPPVQVVDSPLQYRQFEKVEITGSSIIAKEAKQALPVQVISRQEIERSGATNLPQLLQRLPSMFNFSELGVMTGTTFGGPETAAVHGNQNGTLVLLNGRRLPFYGSQSIFGERATVDLNLVPLSAIERVDVLTDGASSRYGSDAVAGVINIITKENTKGISLSTEYTRPAGGEAQGKLVNIAWGSGKLQNDGYRLQAHFSVEKQDQLLAGMRDNSRNGAVQFNINGQNWWGVRNGRVTQNGWPASVETQTGVVHPELQNTGQCPSNWYTSTNGASSACWRNAQRLLTLYPATEKKLLFVDGEVLLNSNWTGFAQVIAGQVEQLSVPIDSIPINYDLGNGARAMIDTSPIGPLTQSYGNNNYQITGGLKGQWKEWDIRTNASTGKHRVSRSYIDGRVAGADRSIFASIAGANGAWQNESQYLSPLVLNQLTALKSNLSMDEGQTKLTAVDALASKEIGSTDNGPILLGLGLNWRNEAVDFTSFLPSVPSFNGTRQNWATNAELQSAITENQQITIALRHDQYSDFGGVQTGKLGWQWRPQSTFMLRSSVGTGFRAPTLGQMTNVIANTWNTTDLRTGTPMQVRNGGNPNLKPEQSTQATLGFRWEPTARWSMGADFWQLQIQDTFGTLTDDQVLSSPELRSKYISVVGNTTYLSLINRNLGRSERRGIDYDVQWRQPTDFGRLRLSVRGTWNLQAQKQAFEGSTFESELGRFASNTQSMTPKHQLALAASLERSSFNVVTTLNYRSGFENTMLLTQSIGSNTSSFTSQVAGFWTLDVAGRWQASKAWNLAAGIQNLTDRNPPIVLNSYSYFTGADTRYANYYGRTLRIKAEYKF
jgi:iron complex outermembrane receptor protein